MVSSEQQHWFFDHILKVFQGPDAVLQNIGVFSLRALDTLSLHLSWLCFFFALFVLPSQFEDYSSCYISPQANRSDSW